MEKLRKMEKVLPNGASKQTEEMLSQQLNQMMQVLDEFDSKFAKKEKQLTSSKNQIKQLNEAYDTLKNLQT